MSRTPIQTKDVELICEAPFTISNPRIRKNKKEKAIQIDVYRVPYILSFFPTWLIQRFFKNKLIYLGSLPNDESIFICPLNDYLFVCSNLKKLK